MQQKESRNLNVLMFSPAFDLAGGAVIAANRLFRGLNQHGVHAHMLAGRTEIENDQVQELKHNYFGEKMLSRVTAPLGLNYIHYYSTWHARKTTFYKQADILNFHTLHSGYFNYLALSSLTHAKPGVLTLHDQWTFTGHCGFSYDCERWKTGCGSCPYPKEFPPIRRDATALEWKLKNRTYSRSDLTVVTPSNWLSSLASQSMLGRFKVHTIPNGLDTSVFAPTDQLKARKELGITEGKTILLFGAMGLDDPRKGGDLLIKALHQLPENIKQQVQLITMGDSGTSLKQHYGIDIKELGYVSDDNRKAMIFSAADLFLFPTRSDNLPCIIQESLACGTPVVAFDVGGVPDMVQNGVTGYLAKPSDSADLAQKIVSLLQRESLLSMRKQCRALAEAEYSLKVQAERYKELFNSILGRTDV